MEKKAKPVEKEEKISVSTQKLEEENDKPGFPDDVDFKRFLGCGG